MAQVRYFTGWRSQPVAAVYSTESAEERLGAVDSWLDLDLVLPNKTGQYLDPTNLRSRVLHPLLTKAELPRIRVHDLRRTAATLLLKHGRHPEIVSEMLGHASVSITLDLYLHVIPDMQQEAAAAMDVVFGQA